ncbi:hypothetical protein [Actinomadura sp. NPDC049753]|uniref:hypothetical protein n=1 Tax=Actinomadura sp. NPDC049753 TaxID=3154739 RepID=UPI00343AF745
MIKLASRTLEQAEAAWENHRDAAPVSFHQWNREQVHEALKLLGAATERVPVRTIHLAGEINLTYVQAARILRRVGKSYMRQGMTNEAQVAKSLKKKLEGSLYPPSTVPSWLAADMVAFIAAYASEDTEQS